MNGSVDALPPLLPGRQASAILTAALLFQLVSLVVSLAMVPLLLKYLGAPEYLVWAIFTTIGGLTLQLEVAIQTLMVRRLAPVAAAKDAGQIEAELARARRAYRLLSMTVMFVILPGGWFYLRWVLIADGKHEAPAGWDIAWLSFAVAYAVNYLFGPNNVWLLATARTDAFFRIGTASRLLNFILSLAALLLGFGLPGIAASFFVSVAFNVASIRWVARQTRSVPLAEASPSPRSSPVPEAGVGLWLYTVFTFTGFLLYRGAFLLAVGNFGTSEAAAYGLALQAFAILGAIAIIPTNVRLHVMVKALADEDVPRQDVELIRALVFAALALAAGTAGLAIAGPWILDLIGSEVGLPPVWLLILMAAAFFVEAVVLVLSGPLLLARNLGFVLPYVVTAAAALLLAAFAIWSRAPLGLALVLIPFLFQAGVSLPMLFRRLANSRGQAVSELARSLGRSVPVAAGRW